MGSMVWVVGDSLGLADPLSHCSGINRPLAGGEGRCWGWATPSRWGGARSLGRCRRAVSSRPDDMDKPKGRDVVFFFVTRHCLVIESEKYFTAKYTIWL